MFRANVTIKLQTATGIDTLKPGEVFKSRDPQLKTLVDQGVISYWCYWWNRVVDVCPTVCIDRETECEHWAEYWESRFRDVGQGQKQPGK